MTRLVQRALLAIMLLLPLPAAADALLGRYDAEGVNPDGSSYRGSAEIVANGETYRITWWVGESVFDGTAILLNGTLQRRLRRRPGGLRDRRGRPAPGPLGARRLRLARPRGAATAGHLTRAGPGARRSARDCCDGVRLL